MFKYSVLFFLTMCFTPIRAPGDDPDLTAVTEQEFNDWGCGDICNEVNKNRVGSLCIKLSGVNTPIKSVSIQENSGCEKRFMKFASATGGADGEGQRMVGFCQMGSQQSDMKCITKSKELNNLLIWDVEGELGNEICSPKYEKIGWF